jgi:transcriptional regulator with XRE-family HTH domain
MRITKLRAWRLYRELTLEYVAEMIGRKTGEGFTHASLSRIERGLQPYSQPVLEALAELYRTDEPSLLALDPTEPDGIWSVWEKAKPSARRQIIEIAKTLTKT